MWCEAALVRVIAAVCWGPGLRTRARYAGTGNMLDCSPLPPLFRGVVSSSTPTPANSHRSNALS